MTVVWPGIEGTKCERLRCIAHTMCAWKLMSDVLEGRIEPGLVFDRSTNIDGVPDGYRAMNEREAIKVMINF
jgi:threonine dehydrogenase-like Zn-dependent dehydrogenase